MFNLRKGSLLKFDARLGVVVALLLLCVSSSALAKGSDARHSPPVSVPYRVTAAQRLTVQLTQLESRFAHHRYRSAQTRRLIALSKLRAHALATLAAENP